MAPVATESPPEGGRYRSRHMPSTDLCVRLAAGRLANLASNQIDSHDGPSQGLGPVRRDLSVPCSFIPPYLLRRLARNTILGRASKVGEHTLAVDQVLRARREVPPAEIPPAVTLLVVR